MTALDVIAGVGDLLKNPDKLATGALALTKAGKPCGPHTGSRWCPIGAAYRIGGVSPNDDSGGSHVFAAIGFMHGAANDLFKMPIERVTDQLGHDAVMQMLRLAYRRAKAKPTTDEQGRRWR